MKRKNGKARVVNGEDDKGEKRDVRREGEGEGGSVECLEELWKRKRDELEKSREGEEEIFKRSKIIERSPVRGIEKGEMNE